MSVAIESVALGGLVARCILAESVRFDIPYDLQMINRVISPLIIVFGPLALWPFSGNL